jgi:transcription antitermination factor NusA-like protein
MTLRSVIAKGHPKALSQAFKVLYDSLEQQAYLLKD